MTIEQFVILVENNIHYFLLIFLLFLLIVAFGKKDKRLKYIMIFIPMLLISVSTISAKVVGEHEKLYNLVDYSFFNNNGVKSIGVAYVEDESLYIKTITDVKVTSLCKQPVLKNTYDDLVFTVPFIGDVKNSHLRSTEICLNTKNKKDS